MVGLWLRNFFWNKEKQCNSNEASVIQMNRDSDEYTIIAAYVNLYQGLVGRHALGNQIFLWKFYNNFILCREFP